MKAVGIVCVFPRKFDEFGDLPTEDKNARLDNFAIQLTDEPIATGYIVVSGKSGRPGIMQARADTARKYLINKRGIKAWRILIRNDYSSESLMFELWAWPLGQTAP